MNVYRNTHAVIFLFDVSKQWTFDYVNNQLADVPETLSVLVIVSIVFYTVICQAVFIHFHLVIRAIVMIRGR